MNHLLIQQFVSSGYSIVATEPTLETFLVTVESNGNISGKEDTLEYLLSKTPDMPK
ncbi:MAG: hypothetical protein AB7H97_06295 [Pseudobdellovibrionaceae bacterium]